MVGQGRVAQAEELGWDLTMIQGDFDFQKMNPAVESAIGQGADAIFNGYTDVASIELDRDRSAGRRHPDLRD